MAKISVIVPVYKVEAYLDRCVSSILEQSFRDFELILVDDGSPDNCGSMCDAWAQRDPRIHVIHRENGGLSAARNTGIDWVFENSESQWLSFVDSDDWVHPEYLQLLWDAVQKTGCRISVCDFFCTSGESIPECEETNVRVLSADGFYCDGIYHGISVVAVCKLYHRSLWEDLRYPVGKLHEDEFTTYKMIYAAGKVAAVQEKLYAYFRNAEGIMLSKWKPARLDILEAFREQMAFAQKNGLTQLYQKAVGNYIHTIHEQLAVAEQTYHPQLRKEYRNALKLGRACGVFPVCWKNLWAYEEAYPAKLFWWPLFRIHAAVSRITGKDGRE